MRVGNDDVAFVLHFRSDLNRVFSKQLLCLRPVASNECDPNRGRFSHCDVAVSQSIDEIGCCVTIIRIARHSDAYSLAKRSCTLAVNLAWLRNEVKTILGECGGESRRRENCDA